MNKKKMVRLASIVGALGSLAIVGCGTDSDAPQTHSTGGAMSPAAAGTGGLATSSGGSGALGTPQSGGNTSASGGTAPIAVPRIANSQGTSILDQPSAPLFADSRCLGLAVLCNGTCLSEEGSAQGSCTVVKLGLGQTESLALTEQAVFYTAKNTEILRSDLTTNQHTSLVRGLSFPDALTVLNDHLYFSTDVPDGFFVRDVRRVPTAGGDVWALSPTFNQPIEFIEPLGTRLLLGVGNFAPFDLWTIPVGGGAPESYGGVTASQVIIEGDTLYFLGEMYLSSTKASAPAPDGFLNKTYTRPRLILEGGMLYHLSDGTYFRVPVAGGPAEEVQKFDTDTFLWGRTATSVVLARFDAVDLKVTRLLTLPIAGGAVTELASYERGELRAMVANKTHIYLAIGQSYAGAILRIAL